MNILAVFFMLAVIVIGIALLPVALKVLAVALPWLVAVALVFAVAVGALAVLINLLSAPETNLARIGSCGCSCRYGEPSGCV
jgi:hypothetical protein